MFTGIIEELGFITSFEKKNEGAQLCIRSKKFNNGLRIGDSIAVNGCCLTCIATKEDEWFADVVPETLLRTNLGELYPGDPVNLERPLQYNGRLDGHLVQGHIDGIGTILKKERLADSSWLIYFQISPALLNFVIKKGSIAVDGISLTIVSVNEISFSVAIIPHTAQITTLGMKNIGAKVNIEVDLIGKYIHKFYSGPSWKQP